MEYRIKEYPTGGCIIEVKVIEKRFLRKNKVVWRTSDDLGRPINPLTYGCLNSPPHLINKSVYSNVKEAKEALRLIKKGVQYHYE